MDLSKVKYAVEVSTCEKDYIYLTKPEDIDIEWSTSGTLPVVGYIDNRPVTIELQLHKINEYEVLFWNSPSQIVDYVMLDNWLETYMHEELLAVYAENIHQVYNSIRGQS